jgi:flagellar export protein FliJ
MPPKFSLQSVLEYHHRRVEIIESELGRLVQAKVEALGILENLNLSQERMFRQLSELQTGEMDLSGVTQTRFNLRRTQNNIEKQEYIIQSFEKSIASKHVELVLAKQDEAVFEKLKEKEMARYMERVITQEKILQDDIYVSKAHRQPATRTED